MPAGREVRPHAWTDVIDLFDNDVYSAIWGRYRENPHRDLGVRWNRSSEHGEPGFPNSFGKPTWHVEPNYFGVALIAAMRQEVLHDGYPGDRVEHLRNLDIALKELSER